MKKLLGLTRSMLLTVLLAAAIVAQASQQNNIDAFDRYAEAARVTWNVPGMSIAIVKDGKVLLSKGYGVRELGKTDKVDASTLFGAMSTTKAMTAVAMAILVDEGKVRWDDKVVDHLPHFRVDDRYVTGDMRVRDLLTHNTGVGNADFLWSFTPDLPANDVIERMRFAKQEYPLRGGFVYQNIMYLVAGQVIEKASGMSWESFVTKRIFEPLGMNNTFATRASSEKYANRSSAHFDIKGAIQTIPEDIADHIAPAGAVWSTSDDIAKWVNFMLGNTTVNGKELLKAANRAELLRPQVIIPPGGGFYPTAALTKPHWTTYGLGWFQHDYRGEKVDFHTGSLSGRTAIVGLIPDKKFGVYIFGNLDHAEVRHALMYKAFDTFVFNDNSRDWSTEAKALYDRIAAEGKKFTDGAKAKRTPNTKPSLPLTAYTGKYSDSFYGEMEVVLVGDKLKLNVSGSVSAMLDHWHFDTFQATWNKAWWGEDLFSFKLNTVTGEVEALDLGGILLRKQAVQK